MAAMFQRLGQPDPVDLVVFDHQLGQMWIVATGLAADGSRREERAQAQASFWQSHLATEPTAHAARNPKSETRNPKLETHSTFSRAEFIAAVEIRARHDDELTPEKQQWIEWAKAKADWLDPLVRRSDPILDAPEPEAPSYWQY